MQLVLSGKVVPKKNSKTVFKKNGRMFVLPSARFSKWHKDAVLQVNEQRRLLIRSHLLDIYFDCPCHIDVVFYHSDNRRRDGDNILSSIFDLLVDTHVLADDSTKIVKSFFVKHISSNIDKTVVNIYKLAWLKSK